MEKLKGISYDMFTLYNMHWCGSYKGSKWGVQTASHGKHLRRCYLNTPVLMRKFTSSVRHGVDSWPAEYRDDFSSLLTKHEYVKGFLQACSFQQTLLISEPKNIKPLPPVHETAWKPHQKLLVCELFSSDVDIQILYELLLCLLVDDLYLGPAEVDLSLSHMCWLCIQNTINFT